MADVRFPNDTLPMQINARTKITSALILLQREERMSNLEQTWICRSLWRRAYRRDDITRQRVLENMQMQMQRRAACSFFSLLSWQNWQTSRRKPRSSIKLISFTRMTAARQCQVPLASDRPRSSKKTVSNSARLPRLWLPWRIFGHLRHISYFILGSLSRICLRFIRGPHSSNWMLALQMIRRSLGSVLLCRYLIPFAFWGLFSCWFFASGGDNQKTFSFFHDFFFVLVFICLRPLIKYASMLFPVHSFPFH